MKHVLCPGRSIGSLEIFCDNVFRTVGLISITLCTGFLHIIFVEGHICSLPDAT